ncbi:spore coat protein [Bacillus glycinifermentans]|uniref:SMI1/KNR4 family protein n=1 Tax=Bacillus glycinifermentans TaxID=1664069 RepID=A0A0J6EK76_9BACI|nr:SMI1/KNR4 family protein [Bacillus glycinifermentans]ATH93283.1 SMI1/KNR4 family protein [Bacillus glycinifermentans]KMM58344.1 spore coat protein [Bacillus glycinifermentans]KRT88336.1 spore coat protein [Bacillus glycinifermentans]MEC0483351.1 SMI1/KNR4 family protein [Bacillus glycinifermentans]MEC0493774.1 SMI1/KNR4 family protein [Bacillus glycinifermentans]
METYKNKIRQLLKEHHREHTFERQSEEDIQATEKELQVTFPQSFRWFLKEFGGGGHELDINGCRDILAYHQSFKSFHIPKGYVIIQDVDEYCYCLDTEKMKDGECPVVNWSAYEEGIYHTADHFYEFMLDEIENAIENDWFDV